jgi:hypothetical protein
MVVRSVCRICGSSKLVELLNLGNLSLTGQFPAESQDTKKEPLALAECALCGLIQLLDQLPIFELYASGYGYESHLNNGMQKHLIEASRGFEEKFDLKSGDAVCDIASNDGTLLSGYRNKGLIKIGVDPLIDDFTDKYPEGSIKIREFFSSAKYLERLSNKCKIVTTFSVFYDLDNPIEFSQNICEILDDNGVWILEQSYLPSMIDTLSFDTICHEHLLYLKLIDLQMIFEKSELQIFDFKLNKVNGGSIQVYVQKRVTGLHQVQPIVNWLLNWEKSNYILDKSRLNNFITSVEAFRQDFKNLLESYKNQGYEIFGLGASTKGNVLLQYCGLDSQIISCIGEINPKKFGKYTPGTRIRIVDQNQLIHSDKIDNSKRLGVILPWHFTSSIVNSASSFLETGGELISPLPFPTIYKN